MVDEEKEDLSVAKTYAWLLRKDTTSEDREREKRKKEEQLKKTVEETAKQVENLSADKLLHIQESYIEPIQETLEFVKERLAVLNEKQAALRKYTYEESYHRRLVNTIIDTVEKELHKEFDADLEVIESESDTLLGLLYQMTDTIEAIGRLVEKKLKKSKRKK